jgi:hypothetical protein
MYLIRGMHKNLRALLCSGVLRVPRRFRELNMLNRFTGTTRAFVRQSASQSTAWVVVARDSVGSFLTTAHHSLMILGLSAISALVLMFVKPDIADQLKALSPFATVVAAEPEEADLPRYGNLMDTPSKVPAPHLDAAGKPSLLSVEEYKPGSASREQQWVTTWLAKRYRVAGDATNMLVSAAYGTAKEIKIDPLLILAVMAIESGFNPFAESAMGAQGLMQVMSKLHHEKFQELGGIKAALNPVANIKVGSLILKDYVTRGGSVEAGLKLYVGAAAFENDGGYGSKVLQEYRRLQQVATGKSVPAFSTTASTTTASTAPVKPTSNDSAIEHKPEAPAQPDSASAEPKFLTVKPNQVAAL